MKLQQLRFFRAVVENGLNITAAAEALYTSQPGVSKQIRLLEDELNLKLFVRNGKRVEALTEAGRRVYEHCSTILHEVERIKSLAEELHDQASGVLTLATTQTQARYVLPNVIGQFRKRFERVDFRLHQGTTEQIDKMMSDRQIDFAIVSSSGRPFNDVVALPVYQWDRVLLAPRDHPLALAGNPPDLHKLARFPLVTYLFSDRPESSMMSAFADARLKPRIAFTARDADVIKTYVRAGFGIGVLAGVAIEPDTDDDLKVIEVPGLFPRLTTWITWSRDVLLRQYHCEFIRLLAPHIPQTMLDELCRSSSSTGIDAAVEKTAIPLRKGPVRVD